MLKFGFTQIQDEKNHQRRAKSSVEYTTFVRVFRIQTTKNLIAKE